MSRHRLQWQVVRQVLDLQIFELDRHRWPYVYLKSQYAFQRSSFFIKVDQISRFATIDPMFVSIATS